LITLKGTIMRVTTDFLAREYLPVIGQFPEKSVQASLLRESTVTRVCVKDPSRLPPNAPVSEKLPEDLQFLGEGLCNLGYDKLTLPPDEIEKIYLAFCSEGVRVPGTTFKLRHSVMSLFTFVETASGHERMLPADWRQTVRSSAWIGKKVAAPDIDLSLYEDVGDGYLRKDQMTLAANSSVFSN